MVRGRRALSGRAQKPTGTMSTCRVLPWCSAPEARLQKHTRKNRRRETVERPPRPRGLRESVSRVASGALNLVEVGKVGASRLSEMGKGQEELALNALADGQGSRLGPTVLGKHCTKRACKLVRQGYESGRCCVTQGEEAAVQDVDAYAALLIGQESSSRQPSAESECPGHCPGNRATSVRSP